MKKREKKGQVMGMSFGMIFAIILMIAFIVLAFFVIRHFLCVGDETKTGLFYQDFEEDITNAWKSPESDVPVSYSLPSRADYVCFIDYSSGVRGEYSEIYDEFKIYDERGNVFISPLNKCLVNYKIIKHIDIKGITAISNPYCFEITGGKVEFNLKKGFYDNLVCVGEECEVSSNNNINSEENCIEASDIQECCEDWFINNNLMKATCMGEWVIRDGKCAWKCITAMD